MSMSSKPPPLRRGKNVCFVVSPIGEPGSLIRRRADNFFKFIVQQAIGDLYTIVRADQITTPGSINRQVFEHLLQDELVVADLSGHNPNVFYELAVRHSFAKPYVQLIHSEDRIPFDLADQRTIRFDLADLESVEAAKSSLRELAEATREPDFRVVTPIGEAAGLSAVLEDASMDVRNVISIIEKRFALHDDRVLELAFEVATLRRWLHSGGEPVPEDVYDDDDKESDAALVETSARSPFKTYPDPRRQR